jgi:predicted phage replisome organizer
MADVKWIKITTDIFDDEKILLIEGLPDSYAIITVWFKLLCLAGKQNNNGVFMMGRIPYTNQMLATIFRMKESTVSMALEVFSNFGMVEIVEGVITIPNWKKHQSLDAYEKKKERDRLYQAERRAAQRALIEQSSDTSSDIASLEEEREKEEDKDKEKEIHSIYLAKKENEFPVESTGFSTTLSTDEDKMRKKLCGELGKGVVFLSQEQMDDLLDKLSLEEFDHYVSVVADCILKGKPFKRKTHYQAILDMAIQDRLIRN